MLLVPLPFVFPLPFPFPLPLSTFINSIIQPISGMLNQLSPVSPSGLL